MWIGVVIGLAGLKFSGSPRMKGEFIIIMINKDNTKEGAIRSFQEKYGWNIILSKLFFTPNGLEEPVSWRVIIWIIVKALKIKGIRKCKEKNRFKVLFLTENPPQSHFTISSPKKGMAETRLVITVAPQKDICPQGKTYPKKAVPIKIKSIRVPVDQVSFFLKEEKSIPRLMCI